MDDTPRIVECRDSPDFVINYNSEEIGLEHERIFIDEKKEKNQSIRSLFNDAAEVFEKEHPECIILAEFWLVDNDFSFRKRDRLSLMREIADYTFSLCTGKRINKPSFIKLADIMKHSRVDFCYNPGAYFVPTLDTKSVKEAIAKKDTKIDLYRRNTNIKKQWLLMVTGSVSGDSHDLDESLIEKGLKSKFDRVYLMADFGATAARVV